MSPPLNNDKRPSWRSLPKNVWAVGATSFLTDISSEMVINILPLFLSNVLGVRTNIIGIIEGVAEATASLLKVFSGWLSDKLRQRKWITVIGYGISALSKPFFYFATTWEAIAAVRWADRVGKGVRTAPRDALVADSTDERLRGLAFGIHRAADTAGAVVGLAIALLIIWFAQAQNTLLTRNTFQIIVLVSLLPAFLAILTLILGTQDVPVTKQRDMPKFAFRKLGKPFMFLMLITVVFYLGNSSDAFLILRAQERGMSVVSVMGMLIVFNLIYTLVSVPFGALSDRIGRKNIIIGGWLLYALVYFGFAFAQEVWHVWVLYSIYGLYYGLTYGITKALIADIVAPELSGTAFGTYSAVVGIINFPASLIAGILWQGWGNWTGLGAAAPFLFGGMLALLASFMMLFWKLPQS